MTARPTFYRVRYEDGSFLGFAGTGENVRWGDAPPIAVQEPDAMCFASPGLAADAAVVGRRVPFTVEVAL